MIKFKGRSSIKQYMPKKPIKRGFKVWMRCNDNGFSLQFEIYSEKKDVVEKNLGEQVVKKMTEFCTENTIAYLWTISSQHTNFSVFWRQKTPILAEL